MVEPWQGRIHILRVKARGVIVDGGALAGQDVDDLLDGDMKAIHAEEHMAQHAVQAAGDGFPGLGIVAAVLGIVKTMSHLTEGTEKIGSLVAGALVGTMLGVFGAYGLIGPTAVKIGADIEAEGRYLMAIKNAIKAVMKSANATFQDPPWPPPPAMVIFLMTMMASFFAIKQPF